MSKSATLTVQQWGNSLAVRIPAAVARSARFRVGQPVEVSAQDSNVLVKAIGEPKLTLAQKLAAFDSALHAADEKTARALNATDPDLKAFEAHGGKLILYHGWNDPAIPPGYSLEYRQRMTAKTGDADSFYRLYMVPGMLHCRGGDAPTDVDWQAALENWVEKAAPPAELVASDGKGATQTLQPFN